MGGCSESRCIVEEWLISIISYSLLVDNVSPLINFALLYYWFNFGFNWVVLYFVIERFLKMILILQSVDWCLF